MKHIPALIALSLLLSSCAAVVLYKYIWPDTTVLQEADLSACEVEDSTAEGPQQRVLLQLSAQEETQLREWLRSLKGMSVNHTSYAPGLYLRGKGFRILFRESSLVVSFVPDPEDPDPEFMHQVSRKYRPEDRQMVTWLRSKLPTGKQPARAADE